MFTSDNYQLQYLLAHPGLQLEGLATWARAYNDGLVGCGPTGSRCKGPCREMESEWEKRPEAESILAFIYASWRVKNQLLW